MMAQPDALDNLRQFGWYTEASHPTLHPQTIPDIVYWPVHLRHEVSLIHAAQSMAAAALSAQGSRIVLALEDNGLPQAAAAAASFEGHVKDWFGQVPGTTSPEVVSLSRHAAKQDNSTDFPVQPWKIATRFYGMQLPVALLSDLKITNLDWSKRYDVEVLRSALAANVGRLLTPLIVWPHLHSILAREPDAHVMTLGGEDKKPLWRQRDFYYGGRVSSLFLPRVTLDRNKPAELQWPVASDTLQTLQNARRGDWNDRNHPFRWIIEQGYCLRGSIIGNSYSLPTSWDELEPRLAEPQTLQHIASAIHAFMSHQE